MLEEAGRAARRAGAMATAVSWLDKAAMIAGDRASVRLLLGLAEARLVSGGAEHAIAICQSLLTRSGLEPAVRVEAYWMLARALATTGQHNQAEAAFEKAAVLARDSDPAMALEVLLDAAYSAWLSAGAARRWPWPAKPETWPGQRCQRARPGPTRPGRSTRSCAQTRRG